MSLNSSLRPIYLDGSKTCFMKLRIHFPVLTLFCFFAKALNNLFHYVIPESISSIWETAKKCPISDPVKPEYVSPNILQRVSNSPFENTLSIVSNLSIIPPNPVSYNSSGFTKSVELTLVAKATDFVKPLLCDVPDNGPA